MIKTCKAYKLLCDACGNRIGGSFSSASQAYVYAFCNNIAIGENPPIVYCSPRCREALEKATSKPDKNQ